MANIAEYFVRRLAENPAYQGTPLTDAVMNQPKLQQAAAYPQFRQTMSQMGQSGNFDQGKALSALSQYDPEAYTKLMMNQNKQTATGQKQMARENATGFISIANNAADKYRLLVKEIPALSQALTTALDTLNASNVELGKLEDKTTPQGQLLENTIAKAEKEVENAKLKLENTRSGIGQTKTEYNQAITEVAKVPGLTSYVTGRLSPEDEIIEKEAAQAMNLALKKMELEYRPREIVAEENKARAQLKQAQLSGEKVERELTQGTEVQKASALYAEQMLNGHKNMGTMQPTYSEQFTDDQFDDWKASPIGQAVSEFLAGFLRKTSGAAITDDDVKNSKYLVPLAGDSAQTLEQKREARKSAISGLIRNNPAWDELRTGNKASFEELTGEAGGKKPEKKNNGTKTPKYKNWKVTKFGKTWKATNPASPSEKKYWNLKTKKWGN